MRATRKISGWGHVTENTPCGDDENVRTSSMLNIYLTSELIDFNIKQKTHLGRGVVEQFFSHASGMLEMSVCQLVHHFGPDLNISIITIG